MIDVKWKTWFMWALVKQKKIVDFLIFVVLTPDKMFGRTTSMQKLLDCPSTVTSKI
jgi:hypothetical protein